MNWEEIIKYLPRLLEGAALTIELVAFAVIAGLILALPMGIARASKHWYVRALPYGYIFFFRGTPLLVQLFLVYYGLAQFDIVRHGPLWPYLRDPYWCTVITMTMHTAAYIAEILRGAIQAVPPGEIEAARALGMSRAQAMLYIILLFRAGKIANRCENTFPAFLCMGLAIMLVVQALFNMAVAVGLAPVTGQPLPLISRGGTSTIINCLYLGIILSISRTAKKKDLPQNEANIDKFAAA